MASHDESDRDVTFNPPEASPPVVSAPVSREGSLRKEFERKSGKLLRTQPKFDFKDGEIRTSRETRVKQRVLNLLEDLGLNIDEPGLKETPRRVAGYLMEFCQPTDLVGILKSFDHDDQEARHGMPMVVVQSIPLAAICEHHLCPFFGHVDIGYIPGRVVVGLSKMARLVVAAGRQRPSIQEVITNDIADAINDAVDPKGVMVVARATHTCMSVRGVATPGVVTTTSAIRGVYVHVPAARDEFFNLIR